MADLNKLTLITKINSVSEGLTVGQKLYGWIWKYLRKSKHFRIIFERIILLQN